MVLPEFLATFRNRLLTDRRFLSFVQKYPPGRWVARKRAAQLFDMVGGFAYSQILFACVSLRMFEMVGLKGTTTEELARAVNLSADKCLLLVKAASSLGLLEMVGNHVRLGPHGAALMAQPWIMRLVEHHVHLYGDLADPVRLLRHGAPDGALRRYWSYGDSNSDKSAYSALMAESQAAVSEQVLNSYDFRRHRRVLDVGGGAGVFLRKVREKHADITLNLFDLPGVIGLSTEREREEISIHGGDFRRDALPRGMDLITLVRVVHDHDDDAVMDLFRNIRAAVEPGATLLIAEPFSGHPATAKVSDAYFNLYFAAMGQGRTRSPAEIARMAERVGFGALRVWPTSLPLVTGVLSLQAQRTNV